MDVIAITLETSQLLQKKVDLLNQQESIKTDLSVLEPQIRAVQKKLLQATCNHPQYKEIYANTDNKYCGYGEYECVLCGHIKTSSW